MNALGLIELYSFTTALCAADVMAKAADVKIIAFDRNRPFGKKIPVPLIMGVKIEGSVAAVEAAIDAGVAYAKSKDKYIISHIIPRPDEDAEKMAYHLDMNRDKFNKKLPKTMKGVETPDFNFGKAIGIIEVSGYTTSVVALDAMCKAAEVKLLHKEERLGGMLVSLIIAGTVSAVKASLEHGDKVSSSITKVYGNECIPSPHPEILKFFDLDIINE